MGRKYVPVAAGQRTYKLYINDIKMIHKFDKKKRPPLPKYDGDVSSPQIQSCEL